MCIKDDRYALRDRTRSLGLNSKCLLNSYSRAATSHLPGLLHLVETWESASKKEVLLHEDNGLTLRAASENRELSWSLRNLHLFRYWICFRSVDCVKMTHLVKHDLLNKWGQNNWISVFHVEKKSPWPLLHAISKNQP